MSLTLFCWSRWSAASRLGATRFWERVLTCRCGRAGGDIELRRGKKKEKRQGNAIQVIKELLRQHRPATVPGLPPFTAGAVGYFAYDAVRQLENIGEHAKDDFSLPDCILMFFDRLLAFDHLRHQIHIIATADVSRESPRRAYDRAAKDIAILEKKLAAGLRPAHWSKAPRPAKGKLKVHAGTSRQAIHRIRSSAPRNTSPPETSFRSCFRSGWISPRRSRPSTSTAPCAG